MFCEVRNTFFKVESGKTKVEVCSKESGIRSQELCTHNLKQRNDLPPLKGVRGMFLHPKSLTLFTKIHLCGIVSREYFIKWEILCYIVLSNTIQAKYKTDGEKIKTKHSDIISDWSTNWGLNCNRYNLDPFIVDWRRTIDYCHDKDLWDFNNWTCNCIFYRAVDWREISIP